MLQRSRTILAAETVPLSWSGTLLPLTTPDYLLTSLHQRAKALGVKVTNPGARLRSEE